MSCFKGQMKIYKQISIDRFDGLNLSASAYFLSHCHSDHMVGLDSEFLHNKLRSNPTVKLFTSEVTRLLLLEDERYKIFQPYIVAFPMEDPKLIHLNAKGKNEPVLVTLLPAAHCPGSVMFLFEGEEGTVLYTGDFRLPKGSAARMKNLHSGGKLKKIDYVHFDSTFCIPEAFYIPSREQCLDALCVVVKDWIGQGSEYVVRLNLSAKYGYEYLFEELYKRFSKKIYSSRMKMYRSLPHIFAVLTSNAADAQIYACFKNEKVNVHGRNSSLKNLDASVYGDAEAVGVKRSLKYLNVTLSTMYFTHTATPEDIRLKITDHHYRLCFSFHSSLSEVCDFLSYIKPGSIHANVIPRSGESFERVEERLRNLCPAIACNNSLQYKPIGKLKRVNQARADKAPVKDRCKRLLLDDDSDDDCKFVVRKKKVKTRECDVKTRECEAKTRECEAKTRECEVKA